MAERSENKSAKRSFASNLHFHQNFKYFIFDAKLRFAFLASVRFAILSEIKKDNKLVTLPARVYTIFLPLPQQPAMCSGSVLYFQNSQDKIKAATHLQQLLAAIFSETKTAFFLHKNILSNFSIFFRE